jgi:hypothetical protein
VSVRERAADYYSVLGVHPDASQADIAAAYRGLAKELHPDARPGEAGAGERFKAVTAAYRVLGNTAARRQYDRARVAAGDASPVQHSTQPAYRLLRTRKAAQWAVGSGIALLVLAVVVSSLVVALQLHDRSLRDSGVPTTATVVQAQGGGRRLEFTTEDGRVVRAHEPLKTGTGSTPVGGTVEIRYHPDHPGDIITNESKIARDVTLWIVVIKLFVGGGFFLWLGLRRLHDESLPTR